MVTTIVHIFTDRISDYMTVVGSSPESLSQKSQSLVDSVVDTIDGSDGDFALKTHWQPFGSVDVSQTFINGYHREYCHSMVKYIVTEKEVEVEP